MAFDGREILYFMSVGVSSVPKPDQSFEELRVRDYVKAYQTTGRSPFPCPQSPDTPSARAAIGLPPLFVPVALPVPSGIVNAGEMLTQNGPYTFGPYGGSSNVRSHVNSTSSSSDPVASLPANHEFSSIRTATGEHFECISAQALYSHFSHEELRYHAYLLGNKMPPASPTINTMEDGATSSPAYPFYAKDSRTTAYMTYSAVPGIPDYLMSIVASHKFDKHSFEELRIAYRLAGKEVGSSEIPTSGALPAQPAPTLFIGRPRGDAFSSGSLKIL